MVMIQTEEIKRFVKKSSTLQKNIINLYGINWGQCYPELQSELEGDPEYITKSPTYNCLWMFTKVKMCKSEIDHTSNVYYSAVKAMRTIFCLRQGRDETTEAYYRQFEAATSKAELSKCNTTTHIELNKANEDGDDEDGT